jgi:hypothetical protein
MRQQYKPIIEQIILSRQKESSFFLLIGRILGGKYVREESTITMDAHK